MASLARLTTMFLHDLIWSLLTTSSGGLVSDINCLKSIKDSLDDPYDYLKVSWNFNNNTKGFICWFTGVEYWHYGENKVLNIQLSNMSLRGQFPLGISDCSGLTGLDLSNNEFSRPITSDISIITVFISCYMVWTQRKKRSNKRKQAQQTVEMPHVELLHEESKESSILGKLVSRLNYTEISEATKNFSKENVIGNGRMETTYKAVLPSGWLLAVKRLHDTCLFDEHFITELKTLGRLRHENLLPLLGFCIRSKVRLLVYKYMSKGSLYDWLHPEEVLSNFREAMLLKPNGTDSTKSFTVNSEFLESSFVKEDVYCFGILLLELITGENPRSMTTLPNTGNETLNEWVAHLSASSNFYSIVHKSLIRQEFDQEIFQLLRVALKCVQPYPDQRPTMLQLYKTLGAIGKRHGLSTGSEVFAGTGETSALRIDECNEDEIREL
ncbi:hypothetical protein SLEP1_g14645 [Rubroshorea leprosula]|uniref:Protein kinase domain-containing protein n=1 Tax=Rubroshorea leprosula TaxID=152421 RepID=A0AAV5IJS0_9ROSI|nr:hypothetical protein SLEP1_g14645 [Rubroshorea leprosula]